MSSQNLQAQQGAMNPMMWANQMAQPQQMQNPMLQMAPFNMISQQIMQEAFAMAQPVDSSDDPTLLTALLNAKRSRRNFKEALNGLHGTNGHSASLWKDYYLEHKDRIDDWIEKCIQKEQGKVAGPSKLQYSPYTNGVAASSSLSNGAGEIHKPPTIKKPSPASFKREPSPPLRKPGPSRLSTATPPVKSLQKKKAKTLSDTAQPIMSSRRSTMNSLSVDAPMFGSRLPAPNASIKVPLPPSRSPSPPANIVQSARGNKFTPEDREYFIKFLGWTLKKDPDLNRTDLCALLAEKAPHHSAQSWGSYWSNNHDLPDKILASARGEISEDSEPEVMPTKKRRPVYKDPDTTDDERISHSTEDDEESDDDDDEEIQIYSSSQMSGQGSYNEADFYFAAKHIASANWDGVTSRQQWDEFQNMYPGRSYKSWAEYYRRNKSGLDKLAARIRRAETASVPMQRARPSKLPSFKKRKYEDDETETESIKRGKLGESD
ncbi:hypothetical protein CPB83DRAFT_855645 [Crepidotus variabilis]|uniref:Uncharacterized protein n=1 Tax=Crepidotus variabilis TaxID=179855 RepID=A0A9P6EF87_9AGAR|nr:hypothetical protein CPB83DRAFT_855645 [Crepidotus variabilis]